MTEQQPSKDLETKPPTIEQEVDLVEVESKPLTNHTANKQNEAHTRLYPGLLPPTLENVIAMTIQLFITIWSFFTIFGSIAVARGREDVVAIIICEIIFTYLGFAYFTYKIKRNIIVYAKFYRRISDWKSQKLEGIRKSDSAVLCCAGKCLLVQLAYYMYTMFIFPFVILWLMWQTFRFYQARRKNADLEDQYVYTNEKDNETILDNNDRFYSIFDLGILSKQASMITLLIQDLPLMIICAIISAWTFFVVYLIAILQKLIFWMKYMYDVGKFRVFYNRDDYLLYFGIKKINLTTLRDSFSAFYFVQAIPFTKEEMKLLTLQEGDWISIWMGDEEQYNQYITNKFYDHANYKVMRVYKNKYFEKTENLICVHIHGTSIDKLDDYFEGKTKKLDIPSENFHTIDRWDTSLHLRLLDDEIYGKYYREKNRDNGDESDEKEDDRTNVIVSDGNKNGAELDTEIKSNENGTDVTDGRYNDTGDGLNDGVAVDMKEKEDTNDGVIANNVNNNEENVVAEVNNNKETQVENEEIVNDKPESVIDDTNQSDDIENNETDRLNDSPVVIDVDDVNEEENDHGQCGNGGDDEYVPVPLTSNDEINENES